MVAKIFELICRLRRLYFRNFLATRNSLRVNKCKISADTAMVANTVEIKCPAKVHKYRFNCSCAFVPHVGVCVMCGALRSYQF